MWSCLDCPLYKPRHFPSFKVSSASVPYPGILFSVNLLQGLLCHPAQYKLDFETRAHKYT